MKVLLIDCDPQRSVMDWAEMREQAEPEVVAHELRDLPAVFAKAQRENYDLVLEDVAGRDVRPCSASSGWPILSWCPRRPSMWNCA